MDVTFGASVPNSCKTKKLQPKKEKEAKKEEPAPEQPKDKDSSRIMSRVIINSPLATGKW